MVSTRSPATMGGAWSEFVEHIEPFGPTAGEVLAAANTGTYVAWTVSGIFTALAIFFWGLHHRRLKRCPPSRQLRMTRQIIQLSLVWSSSSYISLFFPRTNGLFDVARAVSESISVLSFVNLLVLRLGGMYVLPAPSEPPGAGPLLQATIVIDVAAARQSLPPSPLLTPDIFAARRPLPPWRRHTRFPTVICQLLRFAVAAVGVSRESA